MSRLAWIYIFAVLLCAVLLSCWSFLQVQPTAQNNWVFYGLCAVTIFLRIFRVVAPKHRVYEGSTIGFFAGILLVPFWQFVLLVVISHAIEWIREILKKSVLLRYWYIQSFNMAKCIISGGVVYFAMNEMGYPLYGGTSLTDQLSIAAAAFLYVIANQLLLGLVLLLARGKSFSEAGIVRDGITIEVPLACVGYLAAHLIVHSPFALPFVLAPMALIYQAFQFQKLQDESMTALEKFNQELAAANRSIRQINDELFFTLAKAFDARDPFVGGHAAQVATYAVAIAQEMDLPPEQIETIRQSGYLHDIGKIAIPEAILHKPSKLTAEEYELVKRHCDIGADFLVSSHSLSHLAPNIRHHHERWDGKGYPKQLKAEEIPLEARILSVCDSVEAMASDRPYHRGLSLDEICAEVARCAGTQFDPHVANLFIQIARREGVKFITNSARKVAATYASFPHSGGETNIKHLSTIYGMTGS